jgi:hypothetical protein
VKLSEVHLVDATLTLIGPGQDDPPVVSDEELRGLREILRRDDPPPANVLVTPEVLERIVETIAIGNARLRHAP